MSVEREFVFSVTSGTAWVPAAGNVASASLNTLDSQKPANVATLIGPSGNFSYVLTAWCGLVYSETLGTLGSLILQGGGHGDYFGNEVYRYDIAGRVWSRITEPYTAFMPLSDQCDDTYAEYWSDTNRIAVANPTQPASTHNYNRHAVVGNHLYTVGRNAGNDLTLSAAVHRIDLTNPSAGWTRLGLHIGTPERGPVIYDASRNRLVSKRTAPPVTRYLSWNTSSGATAYLDTTTVGTAIPGDILSPAYYGNGAHDTANDLYYFARWNSGLKLGIVDPVTNQQYYISSATGAPVAPLSTSYEPAFEWVQSRNCFAVYPGSGNTVWFLNAPANPRTGAWAWTSTTVAGSPSAGVTGPPILRRFVYVPGIDAFLWVSSTTNPVNVFKVW